jgi:hypothetical protein
MNQVAKLQVMFQAWLNNNDDDDNDYNDATAAAADNYIIIIRVSKKNEVNFHA